MKKPVSKRQNPQSGRPVEIVKAGNVSVPIYGHANIIPQRDDSGKIVYGPPDANGKRRALPKYKSEIYTLAYPAG